MIAHDIITEVCFIVDEFHKELEKVNDGHIFDTETGLKRRRIWQKLSNTDGDLNDVQS